MLSYNSPFFYVWWGVIRESVSLMLSARSLHSIVTFLTFKTFSISLFFVTWPLNNKCLLDLSEFVRKKVVFFVSVRWQKYPSRGALRKSFSEHMLQIYRRTLIPTLFYNNTSEKLLLRWLSCIPSVLWPGILTQIKSSNNFWHIFQRNSPNNRHVVCSHDYLKNLGDTWLIRFGSLIASRPISFYLCFVV